MLVNQSKRWLGRFLTGAIALVFVPVLSGAAVPVTHPAHQTEGYAVGHPIQIAQRSRTRRIYFKSGEDSTTIRTAVVRGTRDIYLLGAAKGQVMTVQIKSLEDNALFDVEAPPTPSGYRRVLTEGSASWSGRLPETGDYQLSVGSTHGNATYQLFVRIQ
jgi:hypothetical protein